MVWLNCNRLRLIVVGIVAAMVVGGGSANADFIFGEPANLGRPLNSGSADVFSCLSADGLEIYIDRADKFTQWLYDIWVAKRPTIDDDWGAPVKLGSNINTPDHDECDATICADGLELYFTRGHPDSDSDLFVMTRETTDDEWLPAVNLGDAVNSPSREHGASISVDGLSLYFSSRRGGGEGGADLYVTTRQTKNHAWSTPVNLGPTVNSSSLDWAPSISSDGLLLVFSSDRPGNYSSPWDLWMTKRRTTSDPWGEPINLGPMINTDDVDFAGISPDGRTLYLTCYGRGGGYGFYEIWQAPIIPIVDFNTDGIVDLKDFSRLARYWGHNERSVDMAPMAWGNGIVDAQDLAVLADYWFNDPTAPKPLLIAHWKLDETAGGIACDSIGGNDAYGPPDLLWRPEDGKVGGALELDGIDDLLYTTFSLNPADTSFSVFAWVKGGAPGQVIISQSGGANWLWADPANGELMTELQGTGRFDGPLYSQTVITDGAWHRVGLTWDGSNRILYVDDVEVARDTQAGLAGSNGGFYFGAGKIPAPPSLWLGLLDDIRIYDRPIVP